MKVSTLKHLARERGLRQYSRLRKSELIELIKTLLLRQNIRKPS